MQFIKKNYEKILLGLVLVGLVAVAVFLLFLVANEKQAQEDRRNKIINRPVKPLEPPNTTVAQALLKRVEVPVAFVFSDNTNRLFNPERWQKATDGHIFKNPRGSDLQRLEVTKIAPLYLVISLDTVTVSDAGTRYGISVEQQSATKANLRGKRTVYVSAGDKKEYGENKDTFTVRDAQGASDNPDVILELSDLDNKTISISKDKPYKRITGYTADLKFAPDNRQFLSRRVGDRIVIAGEEYNIVAITENEVVLSAKSNQKNWTITYNAAP